MRRFALALLLAIVIGVAILSIAATSPPTPSPMSPTRRGLTPKEEERIAAALGPEQARTWLAVHNFGVAKKLTEAQLDYYRARGVNEVFLLNWVAEYGVTPEENEALRTVGVDMALGQVTDANAYHWAALTDIVILGEVVRVTGNPQGPYHSLYQIRVEEYLKDCSSANAPIVEGKIFTTGPRLHEGHGHRIERSSEPDLAEGERVIVFLSKVPLSVIELLHAPLDERVKPFLEREYGPLNQLVAMAEAPAGHEIVKAYKVVWGKAVEKIRTLHAPSNTEVVDLSEFKDKIKKIAAVQAPYCRTRL
ncbi:MAG TPA: hypothetical protein VGG03_12500 [Thermoanaerobaculia bacterium]